MDSLKLGGMSEPARASTVERDDYVAQAKERLRQLASRGSSPNAPPSANEFDVHLGQSFGPPVPPRSQANADSVDRAMEATLPPATNVPTGGGHSLRPAIIDRAIDRLVDLILKDMDRARPPGGGLEERIVERLAERLAARLDAGR